MKKIINIQEYIDSGILEHYALGMTTAEQNAEIAEVLRQYPELKKELSEIENSLELFARQYAKPMPDYLKERILRNIEKEKINLDPKNAGPGLLNYIIYFATPILIVGMLYFWKQNQDQKSELLQEIANIKRLELKSIQDSLALLECNAQVIELTNKYQHRILLKGTTKSPQSFAAIYYDTIAKKTYLDIMNLPPTPSQRQYQLWAIVSGKPIDLGVFDLENNRNALKEIKFVDKVQAFAITLEPFGGQASPSLDQMYVMGGI